MKIRIDARGETPLTLVLEPSGMEYVLAPGEHVIYEWTDGTGSSSLIRAIVHEPSTLTIGEAGGPSRLWNSQGEEMSIIGGRAVIRVGAISPPVGVGHHDHE
jgi:hypothetical protein